MAGEPSSLSDRSQPFFFDDEGSAAGLDLSLDDEPGVLDGKVVQADNPDEFDFDFGADEEGGAEGPDVFDALLRGGGGEAAADSGPSTLEGAAAEGGGESHPTPAAESGDSSDLSGGAGLKTEQRAAIDQAFDGIREKSHYEVLLLPRSADARAIKRSFYRLSKEYHPDKYYRKNLGVYKERLEVIFNTISEAYSVLSDTGARKVYDIDTFGNLRPEKGTPTQATTTVDFVPRALRRRQKQVPKTKKAAKKKPPPEHILKIQKQLARRIAKARQQVDDGRLAFQQGQYQQAVSLLQSAMTLDPRNTGAVGVLKKAQAALRNQRAEVQYRLSQEALLAQDTKRAASLLQAAVDCQPTIGKYHNEFGKLVCTHTLQQRVGLEMLRKAVELEPKSVAYTLDLAASYAELGMPSNAARAYERVLQLQPKNSVASKALRKLR